MPPVAIVMGSKTDEPLMQPAIKMLEQLGIEYAVSIMSAHRSPGKVKEFASSARRNGFEVIIAGAGGAAHLPGVVASWTSLPVIGVPLATSELKGIDALYSIVQMPSGVPVGSVGIGGAKNAALLAARILSIKYSAVAEAYAKYQKELEAS